MRCGSGIVSSTSSFVGMISKLVCTDCTVRPEQSAMTIVDGSTLWASTARKVRGR